MNKLGRRTVRALRSKRFDQGPASGVAALFTPDHLVEIEAIAVID